MGFAKRLAERTSSIQSDPERVAASRSSDSPRTSPGRIFDAQRSDEQRAAAEAELALARKLISDLENGIGTSGPSEVPIASLVEVPGRRRVLSPTEYEELRANLSVNKLIHPIVYRPIAPGKNEIISGANRVAIYRDDLGRDTILGVKFEGDDREAELGATFSNLLAPALPDFEKFRQFVRLQDEFGIIRSDIINASGLSSSHVSRILAFEKLPDEARVLIAKRPDRIGGNAAEEFATLANAGYTAEVVEAIRLLIEDESLTQKQAVAMARPKITKAPVPPVRQINIGKRKLCEVSVRNGVIGLRFAGKDGDSAAQKWAEKLEAFIRQESQSEAVDRRDDT
ncbi:ParB/RepB/Spo0J family partition protein (plasmid) [Robbsia andropogonis]|uniref:ParB/RepB/Spo0J family partition protein n=1 Tax=Robbsia andropogonis TaxID=28092 RepID=UPI003D1D41A8